MRQRNNTRVIIIPQMINSRLRGDVKLNSITYGRRPRASPVFISISVLLSSVRERVIHLFLSIYVTKTMLNRR